MPKGPSLYALLVGVSQYPNQPSAQLNAPLDDVEKVIRYLKQDQVKSHFGKVNVQKLCSPASAGAELPSKNNIVKGFTDFLGQAQAGDTVLFYYSGHGVREETSIAAFQQEEVDGHIANITAYDFSINAPNRGQALLSDKEIRYLIRQLAEDKKGQPKAHVVTIFDCCHSGENTRSEEAIRGDAKARQIVKTAIAGRPVEGFIFATDSEISNKIKTNASLAELLPMSRHVMLSACRDVELAWEYGNTGGAFTAALLDVLTLHEGEITYQELHTRVQSRMSYFYTQGQRDMRQTPQLYIPGVGVEGRYRQFLSNFPQERPGTFPLEYASREQEWRLGAGALHGLNPDSQAQSGVVQVFDPKNPALEWQAKIQAVFPDHSTLTWLKDAPPIGSYQAKVEKLSIPALKIFLSGEAEGVDLARQQLARLSQSTASQWFQEIAKETEADYVLDAREGAWYTQLPFDYRPILKPIGYKDKGELLSYKAAIAFDDFKQIAEWHYLKNLEFLSATPGLQVRPNWPVELFVFEDLGNGQEQRIFPQNGQFLIQLSKDQPKRGLRFELKNHSSQLLYCSLAFMNYQFGFYSDGIMARPQQGLQQNEVFKSAPQDDSKYLAVNTSDYVKAYHWPGDQSYLKLIVSKTPFAIEVFDMPGLPLPYVNNEGPKRDIRPKGQLIPEWEIRTYGLFSVNPHFDFDQAQAFALGKKILL